MQNRPGCLILGALQPFQVSFTSTKQNWISLVNVGQDKCSDGTSKIPPTSYLGLILGRTAVGTASLRVGAYSKDTMTLLGLLATYTSHAVAAEYPHSTLNGTPTSSHYSGTASYETNLPSREESGCESRGGWI